MPGGFDVIVVGGGHAGAEGAWAAANLGARVALVTLDPACIGLMPCNPAIGGLAKGQIVREIDALGGLMGLAADATGIMFKTLNTSRGPAVRGPRCQCDKHAYAEAVRALLESRDEIEIIAGSVERVLTAPVGRASRPSIPGTVGRASRPSIQATVGRASRPSIQATVGRASRPSIPGTVGRASRPSIQATVGRASRPSIPGTVGRASRPSSVLGVLIRDTKRGVERTLRAPAVVVTTGTFMRGLMHRGVKRTPGGRDGEASAVGIAAWLREMGFELGRLKTGTPPRLRRSTIDWDGLESQIGDDPCEPFSDLTRTGRNPLIRAFPALEQVGCRITRTTPAIHDLIRANLDRAPMYNGQVESVGPRYCPSIEDKVVRFRDRDTHHVFLEPESHRDESVYCNGVSTSLPEDVQREMVRRLPGCARAEILKFGYAVEYDSIRPHQIDATCAAKGFVGLFFAGQINGTSGYEEAAGQGLLAGLNAVRCGRGEAPITLGRDQAYIGVMMDDLVVRTPVEPYRMFTSRAEHRLLLRADNAADRLTALGREIGLVDDVRWRLFEARRVAMAEIEAWIESARMGGERVSIALKRPGFGEADLLAALDEGDSGTGGSRTIKESGAGVSPTTQDGGTGVSPTTQDGGTGVSPTTQDSGMGVSPTTQDGGTGVSPMTQDGGTGVSPMTQDGGTGVSPVWRAAARTALANRQYAGYLDRQRAEIRRQTEMERRAIPVWLEFDTVTGLRAEARASLTRFSPATFGQASRLEGVTPADLSLLLIAAKRGPMHEAREGERVDARAGA